MQLHLSFSICLIFESILSNAKVGLRIQNKQQTKRKSSSKWSTLFQQCFMTFIFVFVCCESGTWSLVSFLVIDPSLLFWILKSWYMVHTVFVGFTKLGKFLMMLGQLRLYLESIVLVIVSKFHVSKLQYLSYWRGC